MLNNQEQKIIGMLKVLMSELDISFIKFSNEELREVNKQYNINGITYRDRIGYLANKVEGEADNMSDLINSILFNKDEAIIKLMMNKLNINEFTINEDEINKINKQYDLLQTHKDDKFQYILQIRESINSVI